MLFENTIDAVTLHEPYASMIRYRRKTIETRWSRMLRVGPVLICTAARTPGQPPRLTDGMARCIVEVLGVRPMTPRDARAACIRFETGRIAFPIRMLVRLSDDEMFRVSGRQSRFTVELSDAIARRVRDAGTNAMRDYQSGFPTLIGAM